MKKLLALTLALLLTCSATCAEGVNALVTIALGAERTVSMTPVAVTDADGDGVVSIADALACCHAACYVGDDEGFIAVPSEFGLSLVKLWGVDNGGAFGYCVNHAPAMSLLDPVAEGDHVYAYAYADTTAWSDMYCHFDADVLTVKAGDAVTLTLRGNGYDANWNPVTLPVAGAAITISGEPTAFVTGEGGTVQLTFAEAGQYMVSAASETQVLVPPVCLVTVE